MSAQVPLSRAGSVCGCSCAGAKTRKTPFDCTKQLECIGRCRCRCQVRCQPDCVPWSTFRDRFAVVALVVVNFIFLVCGGVLVVLGFMMYLHKESSAIYIELIDRLPSTGPLVVLERIPGIFMAVGLSIVIVSFLGCYGTCAESVCFLCLYAILIVCILSAEMILGALLFIFRQKILHDLETQMQHQITFDYNRTALPSNDTDLVTLQITSVWDAMQVKLKCCGAFGPLDYRYSAWFNRSRDPEGVFVPPSCCRLVNDDPLRPSIQNENYCQIHAILFPGGIQDSAVLNTQGCSESAVEWLGANAGSIVTIFTFLAVLQIVHFTFACSVLAKLSRSYNDYQWYEDHVFG